MGMLTFQGLFFGPNPTGFPNMFANQIIVRLWKSSLKFSKNFVFYRKIKKGKGKKEAANGVTVELTSIVKIG